MYDNQVKSHIESLFFEMNKKVGNIVQNAPSVDIATESIMNYISGKIAASSRSYVTEIYSSLSKDTLNEDIFLDDINANKFYDLDLRQKIYGSYKFDVQDFKSYKNGIDYKEVNRLYVTAGAAVGTLAVGGILRAALSGVVNLPLVIIIAGAVAVCFSTYFKIVPNKNKANLSKAVDIFMADLKSELHRWVDSVVEFYNDQVEELKKKL